MAHYSFKFQELKLGRKRTLRPMVQVHLTGAKMSLETMMLIDSGADMSMIQLELAEQLGLELSAAGSTHGISGAIPVYLSSVEARVRHENTLLETLQLPVQVPTERGKLALPLLGRETFFYEYDISFRMGYTPTKGKFVLTPVQRRRDATRYK